MFEYCVRCWLLLDGMEAETASVTVVEQLPEHVLHDLRQIANWLLCCGYDTDFMQVYATVRSPLLVKSLHRFALLAGADFQFEVKILFIVSN